MDSILGRIAATVLGLLVLAAVGLGIYKAFSGNKVGQTTTDLSLLQTNARAQYSQGANGYANFNVAAGTPTAGIVDSTGNSAVIPTDMLRAGRVVDSWGNDVTIAPTSNNQQFAVTVGGTGLTASQCSQILTSLTGWTRVATSTGQSFTTGNPPDATTAGAACMNDGETITVTMQ